jgi:hypothetical protein
MCPNKSHVLKISNIGTGARVVVGGKEWEVRMPQELVGRPCSVTFLKGSVTCPTQGNEWHDISRISVETSLPMQGYSSELVSGDAPIVLHELFDVDMNGYIDKGAATHSALRSDYSYTFRCPGGLPSSIQFAAMARDFSDVPDSGTVSLEYLGHMFAAAPIVHINFILAIELD